MLLVIFGAGASFDSFPECPPEKVLPALRPPLAANHYENDRPPLANQLFDNRPNFIEAMTRFPDCLPLIPQLRRAGVVVERELADLQQQAATFPPAHRELAAIRFYLHFALWECQKAWSKRHRGITNYSALLREIERWRFCSNERVCFVTFNYDTMLEQAIAQVLKTNFADFRDYVSHDDYKLMKLHGSIDWGHEFDWKGAPTNPQAVIDAAVDLRIGVGFRKVTQHPMVFSDGAIGSPALSIPVQEKDELECPSEHVEELARVIPNVTQIITIGWRATEGKFLAMLSKRLTGLQGAPDPFIVSGDKSGADETLHNLGKTEHGFAPVEGGFTGLINNMSLLDRFLSPRGPNN